jgi:hypothetical protein
MRYAKHVFLLFYETKEPKMKPAVLELMLKAIKMKHDFLMEFGVLRVAMSQCWDERIRRGI